MNTYAIRYWSYQGKSDKGKNQDRDGDQTKELMEALKISSDPDEQYQIFAMEKGETITINGLKCECLKSRAFEKTQFGYEVEMKFKVGNA